MACNQKADRQCSGCKTAIYCSEKCRRSKWSSHQTLLCRAINKLEQREHDDTDQDSSLRVHVDELKGLVHECPPKTKTKVVKLVGKQCVVHCSLDDVSVEVLCDTVAQVSIVHSNWLTNNFPGLKPRSVSELTEGGFDVKSASVLEIPILGWVPLRLKLHSTEESDPSPFIIRFLVSDIAGLDRPILGLNVIVERVIGN